MTPASFHRGRIWHRRFQPAHLFSRTLLMALADVDAIDAAPRGVLRLAGRWPIVLRRKDHLPAPLRSLRERVVELVEPILGRAPRGPMRLLSQPRCFGFAFDPVAFVYCLADETEGDGGAGKHRAIEAVVAEVTNTPWGERHAYVLTGAEIGDDGVHRYRADKALHVSPFFPMEHEYAFAFTPLGEKLRGTIENHADGELVFQAGFGLEHVADAGPEALAAIRAQALAPFATMAGIYLEAARLAAKGAPFHPHPRKRAATAIAKPAAARPGGTP